MHSSDRTMISRLGFGDPDKRNNEHDLACQYLASEGVVRRLTDLLALKRFRGYVEKRKQDLAEQAKESGCDCPDVKTRNRGLAPSPPEARIERAVTEHPIEKGSGQYHSVIGFIDVWVSVEIRSRITGESHFRTMIEKRGGGYGWECRWSRLDEQVYDQINFLVEIKIEPISIGDVIRQMKFYRSFIDRPRDTYLVLATRYECGARDVELLASEGINHVHLGDEFSKWMTERVENDGRSTASIRL